MHTPHEIWFQRVIDAVIISMASILSGIFYMHQPESAFVTRAMQRGEFWIINTLTSVFLIFFLPSILKCSITLQKAFYWPAALRCSNTTQTAIYTSNVLSPYINRMVCLALWLVICSTQCGSMIVEAIINGVCLYLFSASLKAHQTWKLNTANNLTSKSK